MDLTIKKQKAMQELESRNNLVTPNTNKGGAVVIQGVEDYVKETDRA